MFTPIDPVPLPFFSNVWVTMFTLGGYLLFVLKLGPKIMQNRKPFELRTVIKVYNIMQILYNGLIVVLGFNFLAILRAYDLRCIINLPFDHEHKDKERLICSLYIVNKFVDLVETVFFVLRKKDRQISFLHVFHHFSMAFSGYLYYFFVGYGGIAFPQCYLNVIMHVIMYTYYYLSSISPEVQKSLWWKKYITLTQLIQFAMIMTHCIYTLAQPNCNVPRLVTYGCALLAASFTVMFSQFYFNNYIRSGKKTSKRSGSKDHKN
ncbi:elongation of very long chain fatty acids protein F [Drosophila eugracilis]|uniref:elongation of very long chain fatty acids protein F n=1 Tax=Drosophila eugracilis TaxID=29029 RepID=UPI0007E855A8|nr:elongation of very long chain fatty acids protein F [Drosophila eugracilis]